LIGATGSSRRPGQTWIVEIPSDFGYGVVRRRMRGAKRADADSSGLRSFVSLHRNNENAAMVHNDFR